MEVAVVTVVAILFIVLYDNFKIRISEQKKEVPKDVFLDLMDNKCNNDCENCTCKKTYCNYCLELKEISGDLFGCKKCLEKYS